MKPAEIAAYEARQRLLWQAPEDSGSAFPMDGTDRDAFTEASDYNPPQIDEP